MVHKGHNDITNNIFINSNIRFSLYPGQQLNPGSKIHNNVFYFTRAGIVPYTGRQSEKIQTPESGDLRNNVYFSETDQETLRKFLADRQAVKMDQGSRVADPIFEHKIDFQTALRPTDLRLASDSPAFKVGFKPIDTDRVGLTSEFPKPFLADVFPSKRGRCISTTAFVSASSNRGGSDLQRIVEPRANGSLAAVYESDVEEAPCVTLELDKVYPVDGLEITADFNDRQNPMRLLTVWTSLDGMQWTEIWRADPYHIGMGRDWLVNPYRVLTAKFVKVGIRPKSELPFQPGDERTKTGPYQLRLNRICVYEPAEVTDGFDNKSADTTSGQLQNGR